MFCRIRPKRKRIEHVVADRLVYSRRVQMFVARSPEGKSGTDGVTPNARYGGYSVCPAFLFEREVVEDCTLDVGIFFLLTVVHEMRCAWGFD
jgi:hypothetical protein